MNGYVLAGGRSLRMGVDKARIPFPGRWPMGVHMAGVLGAVCDRVSLVRRAPDALPWRSPSGAEVPVLVDAADDDAHPLWGVAAALDDASSELVAVVACDLPFLPPEAFVALLAASGAEGAVATAEGRVHPLVAVYPRSLAVRARDHAREGRSARAFAEGCARVELDPGWLRDVNRWQDTGRRGPIRALVDGLPWLEPAARARVADGERARLAERGAVDPDDPALGSAPPASAGDEA